MVVARWAETRRAAAWGRVCHAVAGELGGLLQDWRLMLAQLEHQLLTGRLTLQARPPENMRVLFMSRYLFLRTTTNDKTRTPMSHDIGMLVVF